MAVERDITWNIRHFQGALRCDRNFDVVYRVFRICGREACMFFVDGFAKDEIMEKLLEFFYGIQDEDLLRDAHTFSKSCVPYCEVAISGEEDTIVGQILSGVWAVFVDGMDQCVLIDQRTYPQRTTSEPDQDKSFRGSRDGFVETMVFNAALIRRRIRSTELVMEMHTVGKSSRTDVVIAYMGDRVEKEMLDDIRNRIDSIDIDALTMNQESLAECLYQHKWYNPFPKFKFTERPDTTAASILEGSIVVLVDNSPSAMILPTSVFDIIEDADDYYFPPITGTYLRLSRIVINLAAVFLTPVLLLLLSNPSWIPECLNFIKISEPVNVPILYQFLLLEFAIDGLRLASLNTPTMFSTPLSVVAGIILGDYTVSSGWFNAEVMLYMAFVAVANYTQVSFELGYALKFMRIILLCLTAWFDIYGFIAGTLLTIACIVFNKTISGKSYIYPLIPFNLRQCMKRFFRVSLPRSEKKN